MKHFRLTFKNIGEPVAVVRGGKFDGRMINIVKKVHGFKTDREIPLEIEKLLNHPLMKKFRSKKEKMAKLKKIIHNIKRNEMKLTREEHEYDSDDEFDTSDDELFDKAFAATDSIRDKEITISDGKLEIIPEMDPDQRDVLYISGKSGSGKSTLIGTYIKNYKKIFPDNSVFLFSRVSFDDVLDQHDITRIPIDQELLDNPPEPEDFTDSLVIFDDTDTIQNHELCQYIISFRDDLLQVGRHHNIYLVICNHMILNYSKTRLILAEASMIVGFPSFGGQHQFVNVLKNHTGLSKELIKRVLCIDSRWIGISTKSPVYILHEHGIFLV